MKAQPCAELAELRSAYVDGALNDVDRERLLTHLVHCADCRRDVAELRHVRALLTGSSDPRVAPDDLSHRLVSIAGDEAAAPLWTRPFRRTGAAGRLPSERHEFHVRLAAGVLGCGLAVLTILGVGYLSAPAGDPLAAVDPTRQAITEFTAVVSTFPLDSRVSVALQGRQPNSWSAPGPPTALSLPAKRLSEAEALTLLTQAGQAGDQFSYSATQIVASYRDGQRIVNSVQVVSRGGVGTTLIPGGPTASIDTYVEPDSSTRLVDADLIDLLADRYTLRGWQAQPYAGRVASVVEAIEPTVQDPVGKLDGVAARWWIDAQTSLLLGQEIFDGRGNLVVSSRLTDLRPNVDEEHNNPGVTASEPQTTATLTLSRTEDLRRDGWLCADELAGLPLLRLRTDRTDDPELVHLVYSDGLTTVSVIERRGRLAGTPTGTTRDQTLHAWVSDGLPSTASWTSGDVVLTVVTDGSQVKLAAAVAALPHQGLRQPTTMERVRAGWTRILGR